MSVESDTQSIVVADFQRDATPELIQAEIERWMRVRGCISLQTGESATTAGSEEVYTVRFDLCALVHSLRAALDGDWRVTAANYYAALRAVEDAGHMTINDRQSPPYAMQCMQRLRGCEFLMGLTNEDDNDEVEE